MHKMLNSVQRVPLARAVLFVLTALPSLVFAEDVPLMMMRLRGPHTASDAQWAKTFKVLKDNRPACDEVWFSTGIGFPKMEWHEAHVKRLARYAEQLRGVGIVPSVQIQATLGHADDITAIEGAEGKSWGGFTGRGGVECKNCNCPRQKKICGARPQGGLHFCRDFAAFCQDICREAWV